MYPFNTKLDMHGLRVTIMGLGLHHGGLSSALFCAQQGADVTVTDYQDAQTLAPSIEQLSAYTMRFVLGRHEKEDFTDADLVIKGPSVPKTSPYLEYAQYVETDLSLFLRMELGKLIAITGTKGKSTSAALIAHCLQSTGQRNWLVGNIRRSPLQVWTEIQADDWLVMELSSFQLGDLAWLKQRKQSLFGEFSFKPAISLVTNMGIDHQDYYPDFESYRRDKLFLVQAQAPDSWTVIHNSEACEPFVEQCQANIARFGKHIPEGQDCGAWYEDREEASKREKSIIIRKRNHHPKKEKLALRLQSMSGAHHTENIVGAALVLSLLGMDVKNIERGIHSFAGLPHRMEFVRTVDGVDYINDSAATVPKATLAALQCMSKPTILIAGGSNKGVDMSPFVTIAQKIKHIVILKGDVSPAIVEHLEKHSLPYTGCYASMDDAVAYARSIADAGDSILLSPGAASFGMFANAYARGDSFKSIVEKL